MRVLQLVQSPQRRGAEVFALQLANALEDAGHDTRIACFYSHGGGASIALRPEDEAFNATFSHPLETVPGWHPRLLRRIGDCTRRFAPDVVQLNGGRTLKYGALLRRLHPGARWATVYRNIGNPEDWLGHGVRRATYRLLVRGGIDGIVAVSRKSLRRLTEVYSFDGPKTVIPTGAGLDGNGRPPEDVRMERRIALDTPADAGVVLFVGSLSREKRPDRLLEAFRRVRKKLPGAHLWVVGDGPEAPGFRTSVSRHGLDRRVRLTGSVSGVTSYLQAADVLVLTSDTEGIPAVILEAGLAGLPVVATRVGSVSECVLDGETGYLVEPQDVETFAERVSELLRNEELRRNVGVRARRWVGANFAMEGIANQYVDFYRRVCERRGVRISNARS